MPIKRIMGIETEYGLSGIDAYSLVSAYPEGKSHYNSGFTNSSIIERQTDFRLREGDYELIDVPNSYSIMQKGLGNPFWYDDGILVEDLASHKKSPEKKPVSLQYDSPVTSFGNSVPNLFRHSNDSDKMLPNGARLYVDMGHPEYSTPECSNPVDVVIHDKAGEMLLNEIRKNAELEYKCPITILKNNSDKKGHSYGCHENYLVKRMPEYDFKTKFIPAILPFMVTRQIYTGAGKLGIDPAPDSRCRAEKPEKYGDGNWFIPVSFLNNLKYFGRANRHKPIKKHNTTYQLSQRADFIESVIGLQTTYDRPIINTRDEPHADAEKYIRFHVINGDANMSEVSNYLKTGTMALTLDAIEDGLISPYELADPVKAFKDISRHMPNKGQAVLTSGKTISPIDVQRLYLNTCERYKGRDEITDDVLTRWEYVLDNLEKDPMKLTHWLDWVAKKHLIEAYADRNELAPYDSQLQVLDLRYHDINPQTGLYYQLQKKGMIERLVDDESIVKAIITPPQDTRAKIRGEYVKNHDVEADWSEISIIKNGKTDVIKILNPFA